MFRYCLEKQHSEITYIRKTSWKQITVGNNLDELISIAQNNKSSFRVIDYENMCKVVFEN